MASRRGIVLMVLNLPLVAYTATAQTGSVGSPPLSLPRSADETGVYQPPGFEGRADFAQAWNEDQKGTGVGLGPAPDLPDGYAEAYGSVVFESSDDIKRHFRQKVGGTFSGWFNSQVAGKDYWRNKRIGGDRFEENFDAFWREYLREDSINLMQFLAYMCVFINEVKQGNLNSVSEEYGSPGHPGVAYLYDAVTFTPNDGSQWTKRSYNTAPNRSCGDLFNDATFNAAHRGKPLSDVLANSRDSVWWNTKFPQDQVPWNGDPRTSGYLLEADFFKFRGRGFIQTTWRSNYAKLIEFVQNYNGPNKLIQEYQALWIRQDLQVICTISSNQQWDRLFSDPDRTIVTKAVKIHAEEGQYLNLSPRAGPLNGSGTGSLVRMGDRIGGRGYGTRLKARMYQMCMALGR